MKDFRSLIMGRGIPVTLEAPLIRDSPSLRYFTELFRKYALDRWIIGINILNNPMGNISGDPIVIGHLIQSMLGIESIPHIVVSVENRFTLPRWLIGASILGINNLLILGGDVGIEGSLSYSDALELIRGFREGSIMVGDQHYKISPKEFYLGGVLLQDREDEYKRVLYKLGEGIQFFQTQVTFEPDRLMRVLREIDGGYSGERPIPILVSIVPYLNKRIMEVLGGGSIDPSLKKYGDMESEKYISHLYDLINSLISYSEKLDSIKLGVHIIPIQWRDEAVSNTTLLLSNITV